jgi:alanine racemase
LRTITIDLEVIANNYKTLKKLTGGQVLAIVKADAFGHGMIQVSKKLESIGVDILGTADIDEAMELRHAGIKSPIMAWLHGKNTQFEEAISNDIELGASALATLEKIAAAAKKVGKVAKVHLKVDTGLGRNGSDLASWPALIEKAVELSASGVIELVGVFSHLSGTSEKDDLEQLRVFEVAIETASKLGATFKIRHIAASLAALRYPSTRFDMVRVGAAMYGIDPSPEVIARDFGLLPAMRVSSEVVHVKKVPAGHGVSYGYLHRTKAESTLALVPFGYTEGFPRVATGQAEVSLNGKKYPVLARVAMDQFILDLGTDTAEVGDEVVIIGDSTKGEPSAEDLARAAGTINYEIVTKMGGRAKRVFR